MSMFKFMKFDRERDFDAVLKMEVECFKPYETWSKEQYERILDDPNLYFIVAYYGNTLAGNTFAFVHQGDDQNITHLDNSVVGKEFRRQGLGTWFALMRLDYGRTCGDTQAIVEVAEDNTPSLNLFTSIGFKKYGQFPGYYKGVKDAILLHMYL